MRLIRWLILLILSACPSWSFSQTSVLYVNGASMLTTDDANKQASKIRSLLYSDGLPKSVSVRNYPIIGTGKQSIAIGTCQKILSLRSFPFNYGRGPDPTNYLEYLKNIGNTYSHLRLYSTDCPGSTLADAYYSWIDLLEKNLSGLVDEIRTQTTGTKKIVLVGHSLGNFYIEAALGLLVKEIGEPLLSRVKVVNLGSMAPMVLNARLVNFTQDHLLYGGFVSSDPIEAKAAAVYNWDYSPPANITLCTGGCSSAASSSDLISVGSESYGTAHFLALTFLNPKIKSTANPLRPVSHYISGHVKVSVRELSDLYIKEFLVFSKLAINSVEDRLLDRLLEILGVRSALAQQIPVVDIGTAFDIKVVGGGFIGSEIIKIDGVSCDDSSVRRGDGYFTQQCRAGMIPGVFQVSAFDLFEDVNITMPSGMSAIEIRKPTISPAAPSLSDLGNGTVHATWQAVSGANGYVVSRDGSDIATLGAITSFDDTGRTYGVQVCYRVRALANGVMSQYSPQQCITPAAPQCLNQWSTGTTPPGGSESTSQSCPTGQTGSITLSHTCGFDGLWGGTSTSNNCTVSQTLSPPTGFSAARYTQGATKGIRLTWNAVSGADSYFVYKLGVNGIYAPLGNQASFIDTLNLKSGTSYCYTVRAQSGSRQSGDSDVACSLAP